MAVRLDRPVTRETAEIDQRTRRPLLIRLEQGGRLVKLRPKGTRAWYVATVKQIYVLAARNKADEERREKLARKAARKKEHELARTK